MEIRYFFGVLIARSWKFRGPFWGAAVNMVGVITDCFMIFIHKHTVYNCRACFPGIYTSTILMKNDWESVTKQTNIISELLGHGFGLNSCVFQKCWAGLQLVYLYLVLCLSRLPHCWWLDTEVWFEKMTLLLSGRTALGDRSFCVHFYLCRVTIGKGPSMTNPVIFSNLTLGADDFTTHQKDSFVTILVNQDRQMLVIHEFRERRNFSAYLVTSSDNSQKFSLSRSWCCCHRDFFLVSQI